MIPVADIKSVVILVADVDSVVRLNINVDLYCEIGCSRGGNYEDWWLVRCDAV